MGIIAANSQSTQVFVNFQLTNPYLTRINLLNEVEILKSKIEAFRVENKALKKENILLKKKLETFKNPRTFLLKLDS
ncbi:24567_t:CDS:2, partial [Gigaspora margarita]